jgi:hypothetical protein
MLQDGDQEKTERVTGAMSVMSKLDIAALESVYTGE